MFIYCSVTNNNVYVYVILHIADLSDGDACLSSVEALSVYGCLCTCSVSLVPVCFIDGIV